MNDRPSPYRPPPDDRPMRYPLEGDDAHNHRRFLSGELAYDTNTGTYVSLDRAGEEGVVTGGLTPKVERRRPGDGTADA